MKRNALSLVEILIGTAILVASLIPLWGLMGSSHQQVMRSADEIKASQLTAEILEQIENYISPDALPRDEDGLIKFEQKDFTSGGYLTIKEGAPKIRIGTFDDYFSPTLLLGSSGYYNNSGEEVGRIVTVILQYNRKDSIGEDSSEYILRGFVSANK